MKDLKFIGKLDVILKDENGKIKNEQHIENLVVNTGLGYVIDRIHGVKSTTQLPVLSHIGVGSGTTAKAKTQTALVTEIKRVKAKVEKIEFNKLRYTATFIEGVGSGVLNEAAIFNGADKSAKNDLNVMFSRTTFGTVTKESKDTLTIIWEIEVQS